MMSSQLRQQGSMLANIQAGNHHINRTEMPSEIHTPLVNPAHTAASSSGRPLRQLQNTSAGVSQAMLAMQKADGIHAQAAASSRGRPLRQLQNTNAGIAQATLAIQKAHPHKAHSAELPLQWAQGPNPAAEHEIQAMQPTLYQQIQIRVMPIFRSIFNYICNTISHTQTSEASNDEGHDADGSSPRLIRVGAVPTPQEYTQGYILDNGQETRIETSHTNDQVEPVSHNTLLQHIPKDLSSYIYIIEQNGRTFIHARTNEAYNKAVQHIALQLPIGTSISIINESALFDTNDTKALEHKSTRYTHFFPYYLSNTSEEEEEEEESSDEIKQQSGPMEITHNYVDRRSKEPQPQPDPLPWRDFTGKILNKATLENYIRIPSETAHRNAFEILDISNDDATRKQYGMDKAENTPSIDRLLLVMPKYEAKEKPSFYTIVQGTFVGYAHDNKSPYNTIDAKHDLTNLMGPAVEHATHKAAQEGRPVLIGNYQWAGENSTEDRAESAVTLAKIINDMKDRIHHMTFYCHSHGVNLTKEALRAFHGDQKLRATLVSFAGPIRNNYLAQYTPIRRVYHFYSDVENWTDGDPVQWLGGINGKQLTRIFGESSHKRSLADAIWRAGINVMDIKKATLFPERPDYSVEGPHVHNFKTTFTEYKESWNPGHSEIRRSIAMLWGADGIKQHAKNLSKKAVDAHCKGTHTHNYALTCNFDAKSLYLAANVPGGSSIDTTENIHFTQQSDENDWNFIDLNPDKTNT